MITQEVITYGGYVIAGGVALFGFFSGQNRQLRRDNDETATNLIEKLKDTVGLQEDEIKAMREGEKERDKLIAGLQGQVKILTEILQGRDPEMISFLKKVPSLCDIVSENNKIAKTNAESINSLTVAITGLVTAMGVQKK